MSVKRCFVLFVLFIIVMVSLCHAESKTYSEDELRSMRRDFITETDDSLIWSDGNYTVELRKWYGYYINQTNGSLYHTFYKKAMKGMDAGCYLIFPLSIDDSTDRRILNYEYVTFADLLLKDVSSFKLIDIDGFPGMIASGVYGNYDAVVLTVWNDKTILVVILVDPESSIDDNLAHMVEVASGITIENHPEPTEFNYKSVSRNPDNYLGMYFSIKGEVLQVEESEDTDHPGNYFAEYRVALDEYYDEVVYLGYYRIKGESRMLEGDTISFYGFFNGLHSYTTVLGNDVIVPSIYADTITLVE